MSDFESAAKAIQALRQAANHPNQNVRDAAREQLRVLSFTDEDVDNAIDAIVNAAGPQKVAAVQLLGEYLKRTGFIKPRRRSRT